MSERARDIRVGVFVLAALVIAVAGSLWIVGGDLLGAARTHYAVALPESAGLQPGDRVRVAGVSVGRIGAVRLLTAEPLPVLLEVSVRDEVPVYEGATARIGTTGLLGMPHLEIDPGRPPAPRLPPGGLIPGGGATGMEAALARVDDLAVEASMVLARTVALMDQVSTAIEPLLARVDAFLSDENARELSAILTGLRTSLDEAGPRLVATLDNLEQGTADLEELLDTAPELGDRLGALVADLDTAIGPDGQRISSLLDSAEGVLGSAQGTFDALGERPGELEATLRDLRDTVANLKAFSQTLEERPYSLVRIKAPPDRRPGEGVGGR